MGPGILTAAPLSHGQDELLEAVSDLGGGKVINRNRLRARATLVTRSAP